MSYETTPAVHPRWCSLNHKPGEAHGKDLGVITSNGLSVSATLVGDLDGGHLRLHVLTSDLRDNFDLHPATAELLGEVIRTWPAREIKKLGEALETGAAILGSWA